MKRSAFFWVAASILTTSAFAQPPGIVLQPGETYVPGSLRDQNGNPIAEFHHHTSPSLKTPDFSNPYIDNTGFKNEGVYVNPQTGQVNVNVGRERVKQSALDPNRDIVDPGSLRIVNRYERDQNGTIWLITGQQWTSFGVPHSQLQRNSTSTSPNGMNRNVRDKVYTRDVVQSAPGPGPGYSPQPSAQPQRFYPGSQPTQPSGGLLNEFK